MIDACIHVSVVRRVGRHIMGPEVAHALVAGLEAGDGPLVLRMSRLSSHPDDSVLRFPDPLGKERLTWQQ